MLTDWSTLSYSDLMKGQTALPDLLKQLREERGTSLRATAAALGVDAAHLSRLERGEKSASPEMCARVANYYDIESDTVALANGRAPDDIVDILRRRPELLTKLREEYGPAGAR